MRRCLSLPKFEKRARDPNDAPSITFGNFATSRNYRTGDGDPFHQVMRQGAERAQGLPSRGIGA